MGAGKQSKHRQDFYEEAWAVRADILRQHFTDAEENSFVFTSHTIKLITVIPYNWFSVASNVAPKATCAHFESLGFQCKILEPASSTHNEFFTRNQ